MKVYGVKVGAQPGVYDTWAECQLHVKGYPGAQFKSFTDRAAAEAYVMGLSTYVPSVQSATDTTEESDYDRYDYYENIQETPDLPEGYCIYVNGKYDALTAATSYGLLVLKDGYQVDSISSMTDKFPEAHNVGAQINAAVEGLTWLHAQGVQSATLRSDFNGIEAWATGKWRAKSKAADYLVRLNNRCKELGIHVTYETVKKGVRDPHHTQVVKLSKAMLSKK